MDMSARWTSARSSWPGRTRRTTRSRRRSSRPTACATEVEDTAATHGEAVATILQTETDIRFLRRLAARNGFECHVRGSTGVFPQPQPAGAAPEDARDRVRRRDQPGRDQDPGRRHPGDGRRDPPGRSDGEAGGGRAPGSVAAADVGPATARRAAQWPAGWSATAAARARGLARRDAGQAAPGLRGREPVRHGGRRDRRTRLPRRAARAAAGDDQGRSARPTAASTT